MARNKKHGLLYYLFMFPFLFIKYVAIFYLSIICGVFYLVFKIVTGLLRFIFKSLRQKPSEMSGIEYEHYVAKYLKSMGYRDIQVTKASGDYGVDITAKKGFHSYAIQCKLYNNPVGVSAIQQVYSGMKYYNCDKAVVVTNNSFTKSAVELAKSNGVKLMSNVSPLFYRKKKEKQFVSSIQNKSNLSNERNSKFEPILSEDTIIEDSLTNKNSLIVVNNETKRIEINPTDNNNYDCAIKDNSVQSNYKYLMEQAKSEEQQKCIESLKNKMSVELYDISNSIEDTFNSLGVKFKLLDSYLDENVLVFDIRLSENNRINDVKKNLPDASLRLGINKFTLSLDSVNSLIRLSTISRYSDEYNLIQPKDHSDEMLPKAIEVVVEAQMASTTLLRQKLKIDYARSARIIDELEHRMIVGPFEGSKPRKVLISTQQWQEMNALGNKTN